MMNVVERTINLGIMKNQGGSSYLYDLANSDLSNSQKNNIVRDLVYQAYDACTDEFFDWEQENIVDTRGIQAIDVIDAEFLHFVFTTLLHKVDWGAIIDSHKTYQTSKYGGKIPSGTI